LRLSPTSGARPFWIIPPDPWQPGERPLSAAWPHEPIPMQRRSTTLGGSIHRVCFQFVYTLTTAISATSFQ
jgi:hypothetical protein